MRRVVVVLGLVAASVVVTASPAAALCHIARFTQSTFNGTEGSAVTVSIERDGNVCGGESTVRYSTRNGTAVAGQDYTAVSGTATFNQADDNVETFTVPILDDTVPEGDESFEVVLSDPGGAITNLGGPATVVIAANDATTTSSSTTTAPPTTALAGISGSSIALSAILAPEIPERRDRRSRESLHNGRRGRGGGVSSRLRSRTRACGGGCSGRP